MTQAHRKGVERTWSRVNRRAVHRGEYQQGIDNEGHGEIVIAVDASGSMSTPEFQVGLDAVASVAKMLKPKVIHFIQWTDIVLSHEYIKPGGKFEVERKGRGGTEFAPILRHRTTGAKATVRCTSESRIQPSSSASPTCILIGPRSTRTSRRPRSSSLTATHPRTVAKLTVPRPMAATFHARQSPSPSDNTSEASGANGSLRLLPKRGNTMNPINEQVAGIALVFAVGLASYFFYSL